MKILVIDDKKENRVAAREKFAEHEITTIGSYDKAIRLINREVDPYDVYMALGRHWNGIGINCDSAFMFKEKELKPKFDFDIVLVDLMMPASDYSMGDNREHSRRESMPYGFPLMIKIAMKHSKRVKAIAIVSDVNHHNHAMSATLDDLGGNISMNGVCCMFINAFNSEDGSKLWDYALKDISSMIEKE